MRAALFATFLALLPPGTASASPPDREEVAAMLIGRGFSSVARLEHVGPCWVGFGARDGLVVDFTVDASSGAFVHQDASSGADRQSAAR